MESGPRLPDAPDERLLAERLKTIGRLASSLSGELRQSLSVVRNSVYFLNMHLGTALDDKTRRHLSIMLRELQATDNLVTNLSALTSRHPPDRQPVDVDLLIHAALGRIQVPADVSVSIAVAPGTRVLADAEQLTCALVNLLVNSIQAMPEGGQIRIVGRVQHPEVIITVEDTGSGMDEAVLRRAFEPLFSTSPLRTGLGLTVVRSLVGLNGGRVELTSLPGSGTTATLRFLARIESTPEKTP